MFVDSFVVLICCEGDYVSNFTNEDPSILHKPMDGASST